MVSVCSAQIKPALQIKNVKPDSFQTILKATWKVERIITVGNTACGHNWLSLAEYQKRFGSDSLNQVYNPRGERIVHEQCQSCGRIQVKSETITETKEPSPYLKTLQRVKKK
jgi:hypothetical protein